MTIEALKQAVENNNFEEATRLIQQKSVNLNQAALLRDVVRDVTFAGLNTWYNELLECSQDNLVRTQLKEAVSLILAERLNEQIIPDIFEKYETLASEIQENLKGTLRSISELVTTIPGNSPYYQEANLLLSDILFNCLSLSIELCSWAVDELPIKQQPNLYSLSPFHRIRAYALTLSSRGGKLGEGFNIKILQGVFHQQEKLKTENKSLQTKLNDGSSNLNNPSPEKLQTTEVRDASADLSEQSPTFFARKGVGSPLVGISNLNDKDTEPDEHESKRLKVSDSTLDLKGSPLVGTSNLNDEDTEPDEDQSERLKVSDSMFDLSNQSHDFLSEILKQAVVHNEFEQVTYLIQERKVDPNNPGGLSKGQAIDRAARLGNLEMIEHLLGLGAVLSVSNCNEQGGILSWASGCEDKEKRLEILQWLLKNQTLLEKDGVSASHINAALGNLPDTEADKHVADKHGFYPCDYAVIAEQDFFHWLPAPIGSSLFPIPSSGVYQGNTLPFILVVQGQWDLLDQFLKQYPQAIVDLNAAPLAEKHSKRGVTLAWCLAVRQRWDLLDQLLERDPQAIVDLNAAPLAEDHPERGVTLAWCLAVRQRWDLLDQLLERDPQAIVDLNAAPLAEDHPERGVTLAYFLAGDAQWEVLNALLKRDPRAIVDLNVAPLAEDDLRKGETLAWLLADEWGALVEPSEREPLTRVAPLTEDSSEDSSKYISESILGELLKRDPEVIIDLNTAPLAENSDDKGITLAWVLVENDERNLLSQLLKRYPQAIIDLNARPLAENHVDRGVTLAWLLAAYQGWNLLEQLLERDPQAIIDLHAAPLAQNNDHKDITLVGLLVFRKKWNLFKKIVNQGYQLSVTTIPTSSQENTLSRTKALLFSKLPENEVSLANELITQQQAALLRDVIQACSLDELNTWYDELSKCDKDDVIQTRLKEAISLTLTERLYQQMSLVGFEKNKTFSPEIQQRFKKTLGSILKLLTVIPENSPYYEEANFLLADIFLNRLKSCMEFRQWMIEELSSTISRPNLYSLSLSTHTIELWGFMLLSRAGKLGENFNMHFLQGVFHELEKLEVENQRLHSKNKDLETKLSDDTPNLSEQSSSFFPTSKKRKREDSPAELADNNKRLKVVHELGDNTPNLSGQSQGFNK